METENDISSGDGAGDGDPFKGTIKLEGEEVDVEEHDLRNENIVSNREGGGENAFSSCHSVGQNGNGSYYKSLLALVSRKIWG